MMKDHPFERVAFFHIYKFLRNAEKKSKNPLL